MVQGQTQMGEIFGVKVGNGEVQLTSGETEGVVHVGEVDIPFWVATFETDALNVILWNNFFEARPHIKYLSLQAPHHLLVRRHRQLAEVPLNEDTTPKPSVQIIRGLSLNLGADMNLEGMVALHAQLARTENYKLSTEMKRKGFADLSLEGDPTASDFIELFASKQNADSQFYCNGKDNSAFWYHRGWLQRWKRLDTNPRFSQRLRVVVKVARDRAGLVLVLPEGKKWESKGTKWKELLERLTVSKIILPDLPMYSQDGSEEIFPKPCWRTCLYLLDGDTKPVPTEELDQEEVQWVTRQNRVWGKAKMLSEFPDHPEVKWKEREPVVNAPTLEVESDSEGEEETCTANTADNMRNPSVSTIPIHKSEGYESVNWNILVDTLLLESEQHIP